MIQFEPVPAPEMSRLSTAERLRFPPIRSLSAAAPLRSINQCEFAPLVTLPVRVRFPGVPATAPGAILLLLVTSPEILPVPPRVPAVTVTAPLPIFEPLTKSLAFEPVALIVMVPLPDRVPLMMAVVLVAVPV